jgi:capsular polysaccharide transport system ATP-binding protein
MIRGEGLTKYFATNRGRHYVLRNVSFDIGPRAQVGLLGRNGAGKTTLLKLLAGVDVPNKGRIVRQGRVSWPIGISNCVQAMMSGIENTRFACRIQGLTSDEMKPIIEFVEAFTDIGNYFYEPVRVYSSGMRARLGFAITMAFDFDFYILDEVTATGDKAFREKATRIFEEKRRASAFIRASHNFRELLAECESGFVLHEAKLEYFPSIEQAVERYLALIEPGGKPGKETVRTAGKSRKSRKDGREAKPAEASPHATEPSPQPLSHSQSDRNSDSKPAIPLNASISDGKRAVAAPRRKPSSPAGGDQLVSPAIGSATGMLLDRLFGLRR